MDSISLAKMIKNWFMARENMILEVTQVNIISDIRYF